MKIKIIGIGGIATWLVDPLVRFLIYTIQSDRQITLVDGDSFEDRNRNRQVFSKNGKKAEIKAEQLRSVFPSLEITALTEYVTLDNVVTVIREDDIVFLCVDNHRTRQLVSDRCEELENVVLFSGGNEDTDGNVQIFVRKDGENVTLPLTSEYHPEIAYPEDKNPGEVAGCQALMNSEPELNSQLLPMNFAVASAMLSAFFCYMEGVLLYDELYIDIKSGSNRPVRWTQKN